MCGSSGRLATAVAVVVGAGVLAVAGRLLPTVPSVRSPAVPGARSPAATAVTSSVVAGPSVGTGSTTLGVLVPQVVGRTLAQASNVVRDAGLVSGAVEQDSRHPDAVVVAQEPPVGARVPPNSPVGFRTRSDVWPNGTPRRLWLGRGPATARYRVVVADAMNGPLTVALAMPRAVDLRVWLETGPGRRVPVLDGPDDPASCRPAERRSRCLVEFDVLGGAAPGIWTVGLAKRSAEPAAVRVTVRFARP